MSNTYSRGDVDDGLIVRRRPFGYMVRISNGEVGLLEPEYMKKMSGAWEDWYNNGSRLRVIVLGYTAGRKAPSQLRLASDPLIIESLQSSESN